MKSDQSNEWKEGGMPFVAVWKLVEIQTQSPAAPIYMDMSQTDAN
jgi:hypothetical protein